MALRLARMRTSWGSVGRRLVNSAPSVGGRRGTDARSASVAWSITRVVAIIGVLGAGAGCSWSMRLPEQSLKVRDYEPGAAATTFVRKSTDLELPRDISPGNHEECSVWTDSYLAFATSIDGSKHRCERVCVWDRRTGKLLVQVMPRSPLPAEIQTGARALAISPDGRLLAACRDQLVSIWHIADESLIAEFPCGASPVIRERTEIEGRVSYSVRIPETPMASSFSADGGQFTAWIASEQTWLTWSIKTGEVVDRREDAAGPAIVRHAQSCRDVALLPGMILRTPEGDKHLIPSGTRISTGSREQFSPCCETLLVAFYPAPKFMDFSPDCTRPHARVWDSRTGQFLSWLDGNGPWSFIDERHVWTHVRRDPNDVHTGTDVRVFDVREGREVERAGVSSRGWVGIVDLLPGNDRLITSGGGYSVWQISWPLGSSNVPEELDVQTRAIAPAPGEALTGNPDLGGGGRRGDAFGHEHDIGGEPP